jgi:hypothetical protein
MTSTFDNAWHKMGRASQHTDELEASIVAFHQTNLYQVVVEDNSQTGKRAAKLGGALPPIPPAVPLIMGDAIHAMRSSLDHFAYAAVPTPTEQTMFPVVRAARVPKPAELRSLVDGRLKSASKQLRQAVVDHQPHLGGKGESVWLVNHLDIVDKHRLLLTAGTAYSSLQFDAAASLRGLADWTKDLPPMPIGLRPAHRYPLQAGQPLFTADAEAFDEHKDLTFTFDVAFGEPPPLAGEPVVPTLRRLHDDITALLRQLIPLA